MKAATYSSYGSADVLSVTEVPRPVPADDEILVRVHAAEVTKADCEMRRFRFAVKWFWLPLRLATGVLRPRRRILGGYFAGVVEALGKDVSGFAAGDAVFGCAGLGFGAHAEFVALPATRTVVMKPATMDFESAAAVPLGGLNALHFLRLAHVGTGDSVLINGAGGSIGAHAVQIAKALGATVTAVDSGAKESFVRSLGADEFVDYTTAPIADSGETFDVVFDMVPGAFSANLRLVRPGGRYVAGNPTLGCMLGCAMTTWFTNRTARFAFARETREELATLASMIDSGSVRSIVDRVLPLEQIGNAHRLVETEQRIGAIVIRID